MCADESSPAPAASAAPAPARETGGAPFDHRFFLTVLPDRIKTLCPGSREADPTLAMHLADGRVLDVCHIAALAPQWLAVAVFRRPDECEDMDTVLVPYRLITSLTLSPPSEAGRVGFRWRSAPAVVDAPERAAASTE